VITLLFAALAASGPTQTPVIVSPAGPVRTITQALTLAPAGGRIVVTAGIYREPTILVSRPVEISGEPGAVLDGEGRHQIMTITANDVTVRGLVLRNVGVSFTEDRAAIKAVGARRCVIADNRIQGGFFGIYLSRSRGCRLLRNRLSATGSTETRSGNGIHLWSSDSITIEGNVVSGFRDGIYFEFVRDSRIGHNVSTGNLRYGLHFMYSDGCIYRGNLFRSNGSGVAVMYSRNVEMIGNHFEANRGGAAYGLLLKEMSDSRILQNRFAGNTTALVAEGANRLVAHGNEFIGNGWAVRLSASSSDTRFTGNNFIGNSFDVTTNSVETRATLAGNYWDHYRGYDLDRDGLGDVPERPVRLFAVLVEHNQPTLLLLRSSFVRLLNTLEGALPVLTPSALADAHPSMRPLEAGPEFTSHD
jgi:nitrous oxidase accessory protein